MPRQFTALELPDGVVSQLALMRGGGGARWLEPEDYHVTLMGVRPGRRSVGSKATVA
jgi:2'-5' RNA ligase